MSPTADLLSIVQVANAGLTLGALLTQHPHLARRTANG
jgi:hypothetical protein